MKELVVVLSLLWTGQLVVQHGLLIVDRWIDWNAGIDPLVTDTRQVHFDPDLAISRGDMLKYQQLYRITPQCSESHEHHAPARQRGSLPAVVVDLADIKPQRPECLTR